ncbi:hypothetical protein [Halobacterium wangiae]|uniref:hypothetical protein n=1 Tax=Halobacterium wangiae TaxID=2902623 RepID=UPI001E438B8F|nr:hypothetical protein [Halobacterium wangiae]
MRQLDSCDFCGERPEGVFEVVPGSAAGGARRLALCSACRETLQSVVDPLLDDANRTAASSDDPGAADSPDEDPDPRGANDTQDSAREADAVPDAEPAAETDAARESASERDADSEGITIQSGGSATSSEQRRPDGYAQVIRLLQNREGAMPRDDLRALATNAYDLRERTFEDAVEAAVENGDVEETNGGLRTA